MTVERRLFFWWVVLLVFMAGGFTARAGEKEKVNKLIGKLEQRDFQNAVDALVQIGDPAVEPLILTLQDRSIKACVVHARSVDILAKIGSKRAVEAVIKSLEDAGLNQYVRGSAVLAVAELKPKEAAEVLSRVSRDNSEFIRWKCAQALGTPGDRKGTDALVRSLSDEDWNVRAGAARSLGQIKAENAAGCLVDSLKDESRLARLNVRQALLQIGEPAVERLIAALKYNNSLARQQAAWILDQIKSNRVAEEKPSPDKASEKIAPEKIYCGQKEYPCYPVTLETRPDIPSPHTTLDAVEVVTAFTKDEKYAIVPVTIENGKPLNYKQNQWGKGRQLEVDAGDFPALARTGLHSEAELNRTKIIAGRSIVEIAELGRPGRSSGAGFMSDDEDIISVIKGDNHLVEQLGLRHPQNAGPLFHVWNMILRDYELGRLGRFWEPFEYILYNGKKVFAKAEGTKGWQESLFEDEILGKFQIEIWREPDQHEKAFLREKYPDLTNDQMAAMLKKLSHIYSGEMVPYYIMRYGFYEGHTDYRADPVAIAWIFGIRSLDQIEAAFVGRLDEVLTQHFTQEAIIWN